MKKLIILFLSLMLAGPALTYLQAQQIHASVNTSGGNASGTGGSVSYSVGQVFNTTAFGTNGSVSEGVQQPFEISVLSGMDITGIDLYYAVYPNPTSGGVTILFPENKGNYVLVDANGRLIESSAVDESNQKLYLNLNKGIYFLRWNNENEVLTEKISVL